MAEFSYDVVRHRGCWRVLHLGRYSPSHPDLDSAVRAASKLAKEKIAAGREAEVRLNRTDGAIIQVNLEAEQSPAPAT
jgi:tRNA(Ser,Leu) C12 N-acetylase TAN1